MTKHEEFIKSIYPWQDTGLVELNYLLDGEPHWTKNDLNSWLSGRAYESGKGHVKVNHPNHQIDIWCRLTEGWVSGDGTLPYTFTLMINGKNIKKGKTIDPLINCLQKLDLEIT